MSAPRLIKSFDTSLNNSGIADPAKLSAVSGHAVVDTHAQSVPPVSWNSSDMPRSRSPRQKVFSVVASSSSAATARSFLTPSLMKKVVAANGGGRTGGSARSGSLMREYEEVVYLFRSVHSARTCTHH